MFTKSYIDATSRDGVTALYQHQVFEPLYSILDKKVFETLDNRIRNELADFLSSSLHSLLKLIITQLRKGENIFASIDAQNEPFVSPTGTGDSERNRRLSSIRNRQLEYIDPAFAENSIKLRNTFKMICYMIYCMNEQVFDELERGKPNIVKEHSKKGQRGLKGSSGGAQLESFDWLERYYVKVCDTLRDIFGLAGLEECLWLNSSTYPLAIPTQSDAERPYSSSENSTTALMNNTSQIEERFIRCCFDIPLRVLSSPAQIRKIKVKAATLRIIAFLHTKFASTHPSLTSSLTTLIITQDHAPPLLAELSKIDEQNHAHKETFASFLARLRSKAQQDLANSKQNEEVDEETNEQQNLSRQSPENLLTNMDIDEESPFLGAALLADLIDMPGGLGGIDEQFRVLREANREKRLKEQKEQAKDAEGGAEVPQDDDDDLMRVDPEDAAADAEADADSGAKPSDGAGGRKRANVAGTAQCYCKGRSECAACRPISSRVGRTMSVDCFEILASSSAFIRQ